MKFDHITECPYCKASLDFDTETHFDTKLKRRTNGFSPACEHLVWAEVCWLDLSTVERSNSANWSSSRYTSHIGDGNEWYAHPLVMAMKDGDSRTVNGRAGNDAYDDFSEELCGMMNGGETPEHHNAHAAEYQIEDLHWESEEKMPEEDNMLEEPVLEFDGHVVYAVDPPAFFNRVVAVEKGAVPHE